MIKLPRLLVGWQTSPQLFERYWDQAMTQIELAVNQLLQLPVIQQAIEAANNAAAAANSAANNVQKAIALTNSGVVGLSISSSDDGTTCSISISNHSRVYGDGSSVSVIGGSISGLTYNTEYYVYYNDPARTGGSVTYIASVNEMNALQVGDTHLVGRVSTPSAANPPNKGVYPGAPGIGNLF